jgi:hypothetical protein
VYNLDQTNYCIFVSDKKHIVGEPKNLSKVQATIFLVNLGLGLGPFGRQPLVVITMVGARQNGLAIIAHRLRLPHEFDQ